VNIAPAVQLIAPGDPICTLQLVARPLSFTSRTDKPQLFFPTRAVNSELLSPQVCDAPVPILFFVSCLSFHSIWSVAINKRNTEPELMPSFWHYSSGILWRHLWFRLTVVTRPLLTYLLHGEESFLRT